MCPPEIQRILTEILRTGLLRIRASQDQPALVFAEADHLHNLPELLADFQPDLLDYYWRVERVNYLEVSTTDQPSGFEPLWTELERFLPEPTRMAIGP